MTDLFCTLRPLIDGVGVLALAILCLAATLFVIVWVVKTYWKLLVGVGFLTFVFVLAYLKFDGHEVIAQIMQRLPI